jgi:hypothetical protein
MARAATSQRIRSLEYWLVADRGRGFVVRHDECVDKNLVHDVRVRRVPHVQCMTPPSAISGRTGSNGSPSRCFRQPAQQVVRVLARRLSTAVARVGFVIRQHLEALYAKPKNRGGARAFVNSLHGRNRLTVNSRHDPDLRTVVSGCCTIAPHAVQLQHRISFPDRSRSASSGYA